MSDWYAASVTELAAFLDKFENQERVTVSRGSDVVAAIVAQLNASSLIYEAMRAAHHGAAALASLAVVPQGHDEQNLHHPEH